VEVAIADKKAIVVVGCSIAVIMRLTRFAVVIVIAIVAIVVVVVVVTIVDVIVVHVTNAIIVLMQAMANHSPRFHNAPLNKQTKNQFQTQYNCPCNQLILSFIILSPFLLFLYYSTLVTRTSRYRTISTAS